MEIIAISAVVGAVAFGLGIVCGKGSPCDHMLYDFQETRLGKLSSLETKVFHLESENRRLQFLYESLTRDKRMFNEYMMAHCGKCEGKFYAQTPKEQEVADMLKSITLSSKEIAKKLDIKIV